MPNASESDDEETIAVEESQDPVDDYVRHWLQSL